MTRKQIDSIGDAFPAKQAREPSIRSESAIGDQYLWFVKTETPGNIILSLLYSASEAKLLLSGSGDLFQFVVWIREQCVTILVRT